MVIISLSYDCGDALKRVAAHYKEFCILLGDHDDVGAVRALGQVKLQPQVSLTSQFFKFLSTTSNVPRKPPDGAVTLVLSRGVRLGGKLGNRITREL